MHNVKAAEPESIRQPAQRRREKRQRPDFDAPVFRLSALARVIRTQAAKKKGRKIDVDPAFPPEIRGASDADLASTSAESPPARKLCVHQFKKWDNGALVQMRLMRHIEGKLDFRRRNRFKRANTGDTNFRLTGIVHNLVK